MALDIKSAMSGKNFEKKAARIRFSMFLLWLLSKKERHGYDIIKLIKSDRQIPSVAVSRMYPLLKDLAKQGLIAQRKVMHGKRARKVYRLTQKGKLALEMMRQYIKKSPLMIEFMEDMLR